MNFEDSDSNCEKEKKILKRKRNAKKIHRRNTDASSSNINKNKNMDFKKVSFTNETYNKVDSAITEYNRNKNVIRVYLENNSNKLFKYDSKTLIRDILICLREKLTLKNIDYYGLCIRADDLPIDNNDDNDKNSSLIGRSKLFYLSENRFLYEVIQSFEEHNSIRFVFRIIFIPLKLDSWIHEDTLSFNYLYQQASNISCNSSNIFKQNKKTTDLQLYHRDRSDT